uniref:DH domain-containing protein n=1 Tax=Strigamia maritima TaxID=126957 RepID=T1J565_STRMM
MAEGGSKESGLEMIDGDTSGFNGQLKLRIIGKTLKNDIVLSDSLKALDVLFVYHNSVYEIEDGDDDSEDFETAYVLENFEGDEFNFLRKSKKIIYGPTLIKQCENSELLPLKSRPLYCTSMQNLVICFTGFLIRDEMQDMVKLVHNMGGSIRKEFTNSITHLVANSTSRDKYKYAVTMGTSIMIGNGEMTVNRNRSLVAASHLWGGAVTHADSDSATHIVVDEQFEIDPNTDISDRAYIVRAEWFWATIQMDACPDEQFYYYKPVRKIKRVISPVFKAFYLQADSPLRHTPVLHTPTSKTRKRKRLLKETLGQLAQLPEAGTTKSEQRRSTDILGKSFSDSFLDATLSPEKNSPGNSPQTVDASCLSPPAASTPVDIKSLSARRQVCLELLQTENNYVGILKTVITRFKEPLELDDQVLGPLLSPTELKIIFGNVPPIFEVHNKLRDDLANLMANWNEECSLGSIFLTHAPDLLKAYPPFVNFFENTREMLSTCDRNKPRFHAFLKINQNKPECGRQSLSELLIRPVQRLPSIILLLNDIQKHTNKTNADHPKLEKAIVALKEVLKNINENKRKTEEQVAMFDIVNDIDNCPANLLSSHRSFVSKVDVFELSGSIGSKGDNLTIFLFTDMMEICKKRIKNLTTTKSPSTASLAERKNQAKLYKHLDLMPLAHIKRVVNIAETEECKNVFALVCRSNQELKEKLYSFAIISPTINKLDWIKELSRQVANTVCRADVENFITMLEPHELDIETSEVNSNSISKAMSRLASKTSRKVTRAFSFNRTPRKLKRAMSTMISPFHTPSHLNQHSAHMSASTTELQ